MTATRFSAVAILANRFGDAQTRALLHEAAERNEETEARKEALICLARYFRELLETAEALRRMVASKRGREFFEKTVKWTSYREAKVYLLSFLNSPG